VKIAPALAIIAAAAVLAIPSLAADTGSELRIPDFSHLRAKAVDSVDISLNGFLLRSLTKIARTAESEDDPEAAAALSVLGDIQSVQIRSFEFDQDDAYDKADIDAVRRQLSGGGWIALVQSHKREPREDVDVYIRTVGDKIEGLAVVASEPREFTIVNVVGTIDIDKISRLEGQFGIPQVSRND
jgi:hypothetical protein